MCRNKGHTGANRLLLLLCLLFSLSFCFCFRSTGAVQHTNRTPPHSTPADISLLYRLMPSLLCSSLASTCFTTRALSSGCKRRRTARSVVGMRARKQDPCRRHHRDASPLPREAIIIVCWTDCGGHIMCMAFKTNIYFRPVCGHGTSSAQQHHVPLPRPPTPPTHPPTHPSTRGFQRARRLQWIRSSVPV